MLSREARHLVIGQAGADRHALEALRLLQHLAKALAVPGLDLDHRRQRIDGRVQVGNPGRCDLERVGGIVTRQNHAVAIEDQSAIGWDRHDRDAILLGLGGKLGVTHDLQIDQPGEEQREREDHEGNRGTEP